MRLGAGRHIDQIPPQDFQEAFKLNFVTQPLFLWAICLVKLSIGFFLLRVAVTPFYRRAIIGVMVFMAVYTFGCFLTIVLQCTNLAVQWDPQARGTCWGATTLKALSYTNIGLNITTDVLFSIVIPIPMLWTIQMNRRQKGTIIAILSLGVFATAAALVRISYLPNYGKTGDWLWDSRNLTIWVVIEANIGVIAGNLPCLKPLFRSILGSTYGRGSRPSATPKYLSRTYGTGTNHRSVNHYNSLGSKTENHPFRPYGVNEAHMMTTINADKDGIDTVSRSSSRQGSPGQNSAEWLNEEPLQFGKLGGITKTTEVRTEVDSSVSRKAAAESFDDVMKPERKEADIV